MSAGTWIAVGIYLGVMSAVSAAVTASDKYSARRGLTRVPEKTLFLLAACGGSVAMYVCMKLIRHKTKHLSFMLGLPAIISAQCGAVWAAHALLFR